MNSKFFYTFVTLLIAGSIAFWIHMFEGSTEAESQEPVSEQYEGDITLTMYHGQGCECCVKWAEYLEDNGVNVEKEMVSDTHEIKDEHNIPGRLRSCHTGIVDGYVVEGHVHVEDIRRILAERPDAIGLSAPGMPPNSPGMDQPVDDEYQIVLFDDENMSVYSVYN